MTTPDNDFPAEVVEQEAERVWNVKRECLMHDTRWSELPEMERIWIREVARSNLAEMQRRCEVAAREAVFMSDGAVQSPLPRKPQDIIAAATAKAMSMKEQG